MVFTISSCALLTLHRPARFPVHEQSALSVVVVIPLDARRQFRQLALR